MHQAIKREIAAKPKADGINHAFAKATEIKKKQLKNLFLAVFFTISTYGSLLQYEYLVRLIDSCGAETGTMLHSRNTAVAMICCMPHYGVQI